MTEFAVNIDHFIQATIAILAIANPLGAAPVFLGLVNEQEPEKLKRSALRVAVYVFLILIAATLLGSALLRLFGLSIPAFQAGGGLIILLMGLEMLNGRPSRVQHDHPRVDEDDELMVPLAMPMIAGPGAITTVMTLTANNPGYVGHLNVLGAVSIEAILLFLILSASAWLDKRVSPRAHRILLRFMGLILVVMGTQLSLTGIHEFLFS